ncbi:hypothetical protein BU25DRAFT_418649 [Macroventuria anomochaeta]|uniref:Uncharacterized protein n=1 Tax=Macroventuria anomochaeta TaxID=301207 RepID=A0ACB6SCD0_9PLEO|nr:uncharacterized protein BU25DRAFT_418649 [Macroventuria anomochaeta]KAF2630998.1 hypothetical protein BU25DRAFT_418649 [Macroventuria anomochaeta]
MSGMQTLLNVTTLSRSPFYWTGNEDTGLHNFTSLELIEMLEPSKDTLEELYLEIVYYWTDFEEEGRLTTMFQFTALKVLHTIPEMWGCLMDEEHDYQHDLSWMTSCLHTSFPRRSGMEPNTPSLVQKILTGFERTFPIGLQKMSRQKRTMTLSYGNWSPTLKAYCYNNLKLKGLPLAEFVIRILRKPKLAKNIKRLEVKDWDTLSSLGPDNFERRESPENYDHSGMSVMDDKVTGFDDQRTRNRVSEPTEEEYILCAKAARPAGIIKDKSSHEAKSFIIRKSDQCCQPISQYDRKFCQLLQAGMEDAYAVLLLALSPNDHLGRIEYDPNHTLGWPRSFHGYRTVW